MKNTRVISSTFLLFILFVGTYQHDKDICCNIYSYCTSITPDDHTTQSCSGFVYPSGCEDIHKLNTKTWDGKGGIARVYPYRTQGPIDLYCDLTTDNGGWTVFQRRKDGSVDFIRTWEEYAEGFGDKMEEFWLGLETLHQITKTGSFELRIDLKDWDNETAYANYGDFSIGSRETNYQLTATGYSGNAGDSLSVHSGNGFTTKDKDLDNSGPSNCAVLYKGAWWYENCHHSNLNGLYHKGGVAPYAVGVVWRAWKEFYYSMKETEMKFRKKN